jgi:hypothetical protein
MDHTMMDMVHLYERPYNNIILSFAPLLSESMPPNQLELWSTAWVSRKQKGIGHFTLS